MTAHACTIIARNYLPYARVLARSFVDQHPDGRFTVLLIDDASKEIDDSVEPFDVLRLDDLPEDPADMHRMALYYDLMELATAVKPWLLQKILEDGSSEVMYLDPDIRVYQPLDEIAELAAQRGIVITPHATAPMPRDGQMVDEPSILAAGIYNLGFIALGGSSGAFLEYWKERLRFECVIAPERMRFVDQRWIDFVPGMFDVAILRDPTYNVAYWNLDHRQLRWTGSRYEINGRPLHFFHFSGYRPNAPHLLSRHQGDRPRILFSERPDLLRLCQEYGVELVQNGFGRDDEVPYGTDSLANGLPIDDVVRIYFREWMTSARIGEAPPPPDPFDIDGAEQLLAWLNEIAHADSGPSRLSRYHATRYAIDADLRVQIPDPQGVDYPRYAAWTRSESAAGRLDQRLVLQEQAEPLEELSPLVPPSSKRRPGVTVAGYLHAEMGVGQLGRLTEAAVVAAGIPLSHYVDRFTTSRQDHPFAAVRDDELNVNLVCVNADELPGFVERVGTGFFESRYTIGLWAWEVAAFPSKFVPAFDHVDEVWGCSSFTAAAIAKLSPKPVFAFAPPIVMPDPAPELDRAALDLPDGPFFLFCFDMLSVMERKNPIGLIEAFFRAFDPGEGPALVIKTINGNRNVADMERLRLAARRPDVTILDRYLDHSHTAALMAACDCYVSLHRSEGFGLTMAEAMALGKPVVATGFSGNMDFMTEATSFLVQWSECAVPRGCPPYPPGARWAQPDLDHAAQLLRRVYEQPDEASEVGRRACEAILAKHSPSARAPFVAERFDAAQKILRGRRRSRRARRLVPRPVRSLRRRFVGTKQDSNDGRAPVDAEGRVPFEGGDPRAVWPEAVLDRLTRPAVPASPVREGPPRV